ncbi:hypothetical protein NPX13_g10531 [Xylaria arbuscula]|uniref:Uncharacterized protein n=1 Tax=Xylaria arbuscula TaxID=114810 RepID=A0A9W8N4V2_9PEZI|nr:hypothetical protein NPX13_g10531 [Xylaria arbuscula]
MSSSNHTANEVSCGLADADPTGGNFVSVRADPAEEEFALTQRSSIRPSFRRDKNAINLTESITDLSYNSMRL